MRKLKYLAGMCIILACHDILVQEVKADPVRIMPLGDSITKGCCSGTTVEGGYRSRLFSLLSEAGYNIDLVGTLSDSFNNVALPDRDHQGYPGATIDFIRGNIAPWLNQIHDPDIILLDIGTNDFWNGAEPASVEVKLKSLLDDIATLRPNAKILLSNLLLRTDGHAPSQNLFRQDYLPGIISEELALGRQVYVVDVHSDMTPSDLTSDGVHPTLTGYNKMADAWFQVLRTVLAPNSAPSPLLANGSFELGAPVAGASFTQFQATGWTVTGSLLFLESSSSIPAADGSRLALFNGGGEEFGGTISQTFATIPGTVYQLKFETGLVVGMGRAPRQQLLGVEVTGVGSLVADDVSLTGTDGPAQWTARSYSFTANSVATMLTFSDKSGTLATSMAQYSDLLLDHVRVDVVLPYAAPVAADEKYAVIKDTALVVMTPGVLANDTDADSPVLTAVEVSGPAHGSLTLNPDGSFTYAPVSGYVGTDTFTYKANDGSLDSNVAKVALTVSVVPVALGNGSFEIGAPVVDAAFPQFHIDGWTVFGAPFVLDGNVWFPPTDGSRLVLFNGGSDEFGGTISQTFQTIPGTLYKVKFDAGIIVGTSWAPRQQCLGVTASGQGFLLDRNLNLMGTEGPAQWTSKRYYFTANSATTTLTFLDKSGPLLSPSAQFSDLLLDNVRVGVTLPNSAPVATAQSVTLPEDGAANITLAGTDIDGDSLTYAVTIPPGHGVLSGTAPHLTYTPAANYNGSDSFVFTANDDMVDSSPALVSIAVIPVNDAPVVNSQAVTLLEDGMASITLTGSDVDGDRLTFAVTTPPAHGVLSGTAPSLVYTPEANYHGPDSFAFTANDGILTSELALVSITVTSVNDAPVATAQAVTLLEDTSANITLTGSDVDGDGMTFAVTTPPAHGVLSGTVLSLVYTPETNYNGPDSFAFTANDGTLTSAPALVSITVTPGNRAPVATAQSVTLLEDASAHIMLTGSDVDGDGLTFAATTPPAHGTVTGIAPNLTYTPAADYHGSDSFTFTANDGTLSSAPALVSITVTPVNDAPVATAQSVTLLEDGTANITLMGSDIDGDSLSFAVTTNPAHGVLSGTDVRIPSLSVKAKLSGPW